MKKIAKTAVLLFMLICLFFLMSCEEETSDPTTQDYLAGKSDLGRTWKITRIDVELGSIDPFPCVKDNNITYFPDGRYEVNEGETKCSPMDPPAYTGFWYTNAAGTSMTIDMQDSVKFWTIDFLDGSEHHLTSTFIDGERTYIFSRQ